MRTLIDEGTLQLLVEHINKVIKTPHTLVFVEQGKSCTFNASCLALNVGINTAICHSAADSHKEFSVIGYYPTLENYAGYKNATIRESNMAAFWIESDIDIYLEENTDEMLSIVAKNKRNGEEEKITFYYRMV